MDQPNLNKIKQFNLTTPTEEFILKVLKQIATFTNLSNESFAPENNHDLKLIQSITFKGYEEIIRNLTGYLIIPPLNELSGVRVIRSVDYFINAISSFTIYSLFSDVKRKASGWSGVQVNLGPFQDNSPFLTDPDNYRLAFDHWTKSQYLRNEFNEYVDKQSATIIRNRDLDGVDALTFMGNHFLPFCLDFINEMDKITTNFTFNYDKYIVEALKDIIDKPNNTPLTYSDFLKYDNDDENNELHNKYIKGEDGLLYMMDGSNKVNVDVGSDKFKNLTISDKCFGTGFGQDGDPHTCGDYLTRCLQGDGIKECVVFLKKADFWVNSVKEVNNMLPPIAILTLKKFEWEKNFKDGYEQYEQTSEWLARIKTKDGITGADHKSISDNVKLIGYLDLLVQKVNSVNKSGKKDTSNEQFFQNTQLNKMGIKGRGTVDNLTPSTFTRLRGSTNTTRHVFNQGNQGNQFKVMFGGSPNVDRLNDVIVNENKQLWSVLKHHYLHLSANLRDMNKRISTPDDTKINEIINDLKRAETKLYKMLLVTEKYKEIIHTAGDDISETHSIDALASLTDRVEKSSKSVTKKQHSLLDILTSFVLMCLSF